MSNRTGILPLPGFPEAPVDGRPYTRMNKGWSLASGLLISETPPAEPLVNGQLWWDPDTGDTYVWYDDGNSKQWVQQNLSQPPVTISDSPPAGAYNGQIWWDSNSGNSYVFFDDGNSRQWVQTNVGIDTVADWADITNKPATYPPTLPIAQSGVTNLTADLALKAPLTAQTYNRVVNGAMQISQERGASNPVTTTSAYALDQWRLDFSAPSMMQAGQAPYTTLNGSTYILNANPATPKPSLAGNDFVTLTTLIEGVRVADFAYGTAAARQAVLRFSVSVGVAGTYTVAVRNGAVDRTWLGTFSIAAGEINTLVTRTLVIPGDTTGTWLKDSGVGLIVSVCYACGTTYHGTAGWQAGNKLGIAGMANAAALTGWHIMLADVGLYLDPQNTGIAPPWRMPDAAEELRSCQRYYSQQMVTAGSPSIGSFLVPVYFPAPMRTTPAVTNVVVGSSANATLLAEIASSNQAGYFQFSANASNAYVLNRTNAYNARM